MSNFYLPDGIFKQIYEEKKLVRFTWYSNDRFHHMLKAEFVTLAVSLKVPSGYHRWAGGGAG